MKTVPLILPENPSGFRSIPSTEQRLESIEKTLDMIMSALQTLQKMQLVRDEAERFAKVRDNERTKPAEREELPQATFSVPKSNIAPGIMDALNKAKEPLFKQPAQSVEEEPRRMSGLPAKQQIEQWIARNFQTIIYFRRAAQFGLVTAKIEAKSIKADSTHKYTHRVKIKSTVMPGSFNPTIFGIDEAREVVAYLESLGVNVNTSALDNE